MSNRQAIEARLFSWTDWDEIGAGIFQFYRGQLNIDLGVLKAGTSYTHAVIDSDQSTLRICVDDVDYYFDLILQATYTHSKDWSAGIFDEL